MKIIFQIILFLCVSISLAAQKITCEELMKLPFGKYLMNDEEDSLKLIIANLEHCDFEDFERETVLLSVFIQTTMVAKGENTTVQDLYNEVLTFRQSDEYEAVKAFAEKQRSFNQDYLSKKITRRNWKKGQPLISELFGFEKMELNTFINPLFEKQGKKLDLTYGYFLADFKTYMNSKYHLSNAAKRDSTDFDFGSDFYPFPSMNYDIRISNIDVTKPTLIYFYGYGAVNCQKLNENAFGNPKLFKLVDSSYNFITLPVDARTKLSPDLKAELEAKYSVKRFSDVGRLNVHLQTTLFQEQVQPLFVIVNQNGEVLGKFDYRTMRNTDELVEDLEKVVEEFNN
jgi:hypothetical protein